MKKVDTYGIKINTEDLRATAKSTTNYGAYSSEYDEVFYDTDSGEVWSVYQNSLGTNTWTVYHDPAVIKIGNYQHHVTQQQLMDAIKAALECKDVKIYNS